MSRPHLHTQKVSAYEAIEERIGMGEGKYGTNEAKHESLLMSYYTLLVVLTVALAWRSFLTTLEWPLEDAVISAVSPLCEEVEV